MPSKIEGLNQDQWVAVLPCPGCSVGYADGGRSQMRAEFPACQSFLHEHFWRPAVCRPQRSPPAGSLHPCTFGCPERAGPTALRASGLLEEATVSFLLNNTVLTRQVLLWVPAVTTK